VRTWSLGDLRQKVGNREFKVGMAARLANGGSSLSLLNVAKYELYDARGGKGVESSKGHHGLTPLEPLRTLKESG